MCANASEAKIVRSTTTRTSVAHHECEREPVAATGRWTPVATSAVGRGGGRSVCHSQTTVAATATMPKANAGASHLTVSSRKKPAVQTPATNGHQLSPVRTRRCIGRARRGWVTSVSRPPNTLPGSQCAPATTSSVRPGRLHSGSRESTSGMLRTP